MPQNHSLAPIISGYYYCNTIIICAGSAAYGGSAVFGGSLVELDEIISCLQIYSEPLSMYEIENAHYRCAPGRYSDELINNLPYLVLSWSNNHKITDER